MAEKTAQVPQMYATKPSWFEDRGEGLGRKSSTCEICQADGVLRCMSVAVRGGGGDAQRQRADSNGTHPSENEAIWPVSRCRISQEFPRYHSRVLQPPVVTERTYDSQHYTHAPILSPIHHTYHPFSFLPSTPPPYPQTSPSTASALSSPPLPKL